VHIVKSGQQQKTQWGYLRVKSMSTKPTIIIESVPAKTRTPTLFCIVPSIAICGNLAAKDVKNVRNTIMEYRYKKNSEMQIHQKKEVRELRK